MGLRRNLRRWISDFRKIYIDKDRTRIAQIKWSKDQGDSILKYDLPIRDCLIVFDVGGFRGDFTDEYRRRFNSECYLFEPVQEFYEHCLKRFDGDGMVHCFAFGLSGENETLNISLLEDASSTLMSVDKGARQEVEVRKASEFLDASGVPKVDLMKINIEGGEYSLLDDLISSGWISKIRVLQIQFHDFVENAEQMRDDLRAQLSTTHRELWNYDFVWESWLIKNDGG